MKKKRAFTVQRVIFSLLSALIMAAVFCLSCENADESSETSGHITEFVLRFLIKGYDGYTPEKQAEIHGIVSHIVRKCAHFSAYTALGFCTSCAVGKRKLFSVGSLIAWGICILYACSDELHQSFVPGRSCELRDVLIDSSGGLTGLILSMIAMTAVTRLIGKKQQ